MVHHSICPQWTKVVKEMCYRRVQAPRHSRLDPESASGSEAGVDLAPSNTASRATRVGDREREEVTLLLGDAFADGLLTREEFDTRSAAALTAHNVGDLVVLTEDLPAAWRTQRSQSRHSARQAVQAARRVGAEVRRYAAVMLLLLIIWLVAGLTAQAWYPWFVWPAIGWGIGLVARTRSVIRGGPERASAA
jgi:uncharacterized protein DUF1707/2TM domain-containing protein